MTITAAELVDARTHAAALLTDTCNILGMTRTQDEYGGWSESWGTAVAGVACRLMPLTQQGILAQLGDHPTRTSFHVWSVAYDQAVDLDAHRVEIGTDIYEIRLPVEEVGTWRLIKRFVVAKVSQ